MRGQIQTRGRYGKFKSLIVQARTTFDLLPLVYHLTERKGSNLRPVPL